MTRRQRSILAVATLTQAVAMGVTIGVFPLFLEPLEASFDVSRTVISFGPILVMFALSGAGILAGSVLDKGRVRKAMLFGAGMMTIGLLMASWSPNLLAMAVAAMAAGFSIPFVGPLAGMTLVTRSFSEGQGRAFGIMSMGPALGMGFFAGFTGFLLQTLDWRSIYLLLAGVTAVVLIPVIWFVIPAQLDAPDEGRGEEPEAVGLGDVLRRPVFWLSALVFALSAGISTGWTNHLGAFLAGVGFTESQLTSLVAAQFWMGVPGALAFGILSDRLSLTGLYLAMLGYQVIAFALFGLGTPAIVIASLGIGLGLASGGLIPLYMTLLGGRLEPQVLGRAMGLSNLVMLPVMALATVGAAAIFESDGNYDRAAILFSMGMLIAIGCLLLSNRSASKS